MALTGKDTAEKIWNYLIAAGLSKHGAAGLMGNLEKESGLNPENLENLCERRLKEAGKPYCTDKTYTAAVDSGQISRAEFLNPLPGKQYGYGLAQWTSTGRKAGLYDLAKSKGVSIGDLEMQLEFLIKELSTSYKGVLSVLKAAADVKTASDKVLTGFERPADQSETAKTERARCGQAYFDKYAASGGGKEYYTAEDGSTQELTKEKELEMLDKAYETHSRFMAANTQIWSELRGFQAQTVYHSGSSEKETIAVKKQSADIKEQAYHAFMDAVSEKNSGMLKQEKGSLNHFRLNLGISSSARNTLNGIWDYYANLKDKNA